MTVIAVLGSAPCGLDDLAALTSIHSDVSICALNRSIFLPVDFDYFLTGHPSDFSDEVVCLKDSRRKFEATGAERCSGYDTIFRPSGRMAWGGGAAYAICMFVPRGHRVVLCGCPFDASGHFNDASLAYHASELWDWFLLGHPHRAGLNVNVRSMSGQTRELFGYPTKEWLNEPCQ